MALIDKTFFVIDCSIAQLGQPTVVAKLTAYINRYEPQFLATLLGLQFYNDFKLGLLADPVEQRWSELRDGKEYTDVNGNLFKFEGVASSTTKISPIANYVYYWFTRNQATFSTGSGELAPDLENGTRADASEKLAYAWNEMVKLNFSVIHFLETNKTTYPEWKGLNWSRSDYEYFFGWWPIYWNAVYSYTWPEKCARPDIFIPINTFGL